MSALNDQMLGGTVITLRPFSGTVIIKAPIGGSAVIAVKPLYGTAI